ncbi:MAG: 2-hydroxyacyl-CoA dehydratase [Sedimentisphaerales bacterium]|nr:2-hydroxyacyl-CoA dehydratase [Sedimentisphaerales bacterium]
MREPNETIAYTCPYVPAEWIAAHGFRPQRLVPTSGTPQDAPVPAEGVCPYVRGFLAEVGDGRNVAAVVLTTVCDQMRRAFDLLAMQCTAPAFLLNVPSTWQTTSAQRLYLDELKRLGRFLVRLGGAAPGKDRLARVMLDSDNVAEPDAQPARAKGVPVAVVGGPLMQRDQVLFDIIADSGGCVVLDATETGQRGRRGPFDRRALADDPLMELARAYFEIPDASRRPNSSLYVWLKRQIGHSGACGIVFHHYVWCDTWRAEFARLKEWTDLPVLELDSDGHDETDRARVQNRIRAFVEMLQ